MKPTLTTERLLLRKWEPADLDAYAEMFAEPGIAQFLNPGGKPLTRPEAWRGLALTIGHWELHGFGMFAVVERSTKNFVGRIGPLQPEGWPDFEIGWALRQRYWGQGYATEAVTECIKYAFRELDKPHLISVIDPENQSSIRVAQRVGEQLEGYTTLPHVPDKQFLQYGLFRENWRG